MAPKAPKRDAREKAALQVVSGHTLRTKADYKSVCDALRGRDDLIARFFRQLVDTGELSEAGKVLKPKPKNPTPIVAPGATKQESDARDEEEQEEGPEQQDLKVLHRNFSKWNLLPVGYLLQILQYCEGAALSSGNMKCFVRRGCKYPGKNTLLELLEMLTDVDPDEDVQGRSLQELCNEAFSANEKNGRRARDITLPEGLAEGLYEAVVQEPVLKLRYRPISAEIDVPGLEAKAADEIQWFLVYSKQRAYFKVNNHGKHYAAKLFADAGVRLDDPYVSGVRPKSIGSLGGGLGRSGSCTSASRAMTRSLSEWTEPDESGSLSAPPTSSAEAEGSLSDGAVDLEVLKAVQASRQQPVDEAPEQPTEEHGDSDIEMGESGFAQLQASMMGLMQTAVVKGEPVYHEAMCEADAETCEAEREFFLSTE